VDGGSGSQDWIDDEFAASRFSDVRLGRRLRQLVTQMAGAVGGPIPLACQDWANTKAAYRFLSNSDVSEGKILHGHFQSTALRVAAVEGPILVLQDTTEFSYERKAGTGWGHRLCPKQARDYRDCQATHHLRAVDA